VNHYTPPAQQLRRLKRVLILWRENWHPDECGFQGVLTVAAKSIQLSVFTRTGFGWRGFLFD
jgi:hypothetical protein